MSVFRVGLRLLGLDLERLIDLQTSSALLYCAWVRCWMISPWITEISYFLNLGIDLIPLISTGNAKNLFFIWHTIGSS